MPVESRSAIPVSELRMDSIRDIGDRWMLLTAGDYRPGAFNAMTASWGALGVLWNKPAAFIFVRPSRYTYEFIEKSKVFSICFFPDACRNALALCGAKSGRDGNKIAESGLTPQAARLISAPVYREAELALECRLLYFQDVQPAHFLDPQIEANYHGTNYHRMYIGEILGAEGVPRYRASDR